MCGLVGIVAGKNVAPDIYDALTVLQHRGQDAAGIMTCDRGRFSLRKSEGLVRDVFRQQHMQRLEGNVGIGHVRYPTAGSSGPALAQPFMLIRLTALLWLTTVISLTPSSWEKSCLRMICVT